MYIEITEIMGKCFTDVPKTAARLWILVPLRVGRLGDCCFTYWDLLTVFHPRLYIFTIAFIGNLFKLYYILDFDGHLNRKECLNRTLERALIWNFLYRGSWYLAKATFKCILLKVKASVVDFTINLQLNSVIVSVDLFFFLTKHHVLLNIVTCCLTIEFSLVDSSSSFSSAQCIDVLPCDLA